MTAHIRLVSSEGEDGPGLEGKAIGLDEATVGLPEEAGSDTSRSEQSRRNEMLGEAALPLFAEKAPRSPSAPTLKASRCARSRPR
jgi:hypothetical protein